MCAWFVMNLHRFGLVLVYRHRRRRLPTAVNAMVLFGCSKEAFESLVSICLLFSWVCIYIHRGIEVGSRDLRHLP